MMKNEHPNEHYFQRKSRLVRKRELLSRIGIASSTLYDWLNPSSPRFDPSFPRQIKIGKATVAWLEEELELWMQARMRERC